jgi:hypothetical protein
MAFKRRPHPTAKLVLIDRTDCDTGPPNKTKEALDKRKYDQNTNLRLAQKRQRHPFSAKTDAGLEATTGNAYYTALATAIAACQTSYDIYLAAKAEASQGGTDLISLRDTARANLVALLRAFFSSINSIANGNVDMLLSTAFPIRSTNRTPSARLLHRMHRQLHKPRRQAP